MKKYLLDYTNIYRKNIFKFVGFPGLIAFCKISIQCIKERFLFFGCMHDLRKKIKSELRPKTCSTDVVKSFKDEFRFFTTLCVEKKLA